MEFDIGSALFGSVATIIIAVLAILAFFTLILGKVRHQLKYVLSKLYSRLSLMLIAIFDVVAAFDPSQTVLGIGIGPIAGITIFLVEWGLHPPPGQRFQLKRLGPSLIEGFIAMVIVMIPTPVAGIFVTWFGVWGDKKKN